MTSRVRSPDRSILDRLAPLAELALAELDCVLPPGRCSPPSIHRAMRYSVFGPGKRIRPILVLETARIFGMAPRRAAPFAAAVELIHSYSLVHDDLPCMDDDEYRRGRLTCHKRFDEATAVLTGDALLTLAFSVTAAGVARAKISAKRGLELVHELALAAGTGGLIGGQVDDMEAEGHPITLSRLASIHRRKTGALLTACLRVGAILGEATPGELARVTRYGRLFGQIFQITDDILDVVGDFSSLGKPIGSDDRNAKATYVSLLSVARARSIVARLCRQAHRELDELDHRRVTNLRELVDYLARRVK